MEQQNNSKKNSAPICPLCGCVEANLRLKTADYFLTGEDFHIAECNSCGHLYTFPWPDISKLEHYYESHNYLSHKERPENTFEYIYNTIRWINLRKKFRKSSENLIPQLVLDYGCGRGDFLRLAVKKGWKAIGVEPNHEARNYAARIHGLEIMTLDGMSKLSKQSFALITLFHVLEHVPNAKDVLKQLSELLQPNGRIVIAVPNPLSYDAKHYKAFWAAWDVPRHLHHFTSEIIIGLAKEAGLQYEAAVPMFWDAFYISIMSEKYRKSRAQLVRALSIGFISNLMAIRNGQYSSIMYLFRK